MSESLDHPARGVPPPADARVGRRLIVAMQESLSDVERTLGDLRRAGFATGDITLVARAARGAAQPATDVLRHLGVPRAVECRGLGTLHIGGGAVRPLHDLGSRATLGDLGQAFAAAGLPAADTLIYELGLIRGQCLVAVRAADAAQGRVAHRLFLRCGSGEIHVYDA